MATILLTTEVGRTYGHAGHLLQVGRLLQARGHRLVAASTSVVHSASMLSAAGIPVLQAPVWPVLREERFAGYGDRLVQFGFGSFAGLKLLLESWDNLLGLVQPDLVLADHSPAAVLAAHGTIPTAHIGNASVLPPTSPEEFPRLDPNVDDVVDQSRILGIVQSVQRHRHKPIPRSLPAIFESPARAVLSFDEFDPYADVRSEQLLGPMEPMPMPTALPDRPRIFAYLMADRPQVRTWASALLDVDAEIEVHVRDDSGLISRYLRRYGAEVHLQPAPIHEVLPRASLVVSNGTLGLAQAALAGGRPHLALPISLETETNTRSAIRLGVGRRADANGSRDEIAAKITSALADRGMAERAQSYAVRMMRRLPTFADEKAASMCLAMLADATSVS